MEKRLFQKLDELNLADCEDGGNRVAICPDFVSCNSGHKAGGKVTMGVPHQLAVEYLQEKRVFILLAIDKQEFQKLIN